MGAQIGTQPDRVAPATLIGQGLHASLLAQSALERQWLRHLPVQVPLAQSAFWLHELLSEQVPSQIPLSHSLAQSLH